MKKYGLGSLICLFISLREINRFPRFKGTGFDGIVKNDTQKLLLGLMLRMDPLARYSAYEILNHEIFTGNKGGKQNKAFVEIFNDF